MGIVINLIHNEPFLKGFLQGIVPGIILGAVYFYKVKLPEIKRRRAALEKEHQERLQQLNNQLFESLGNRISRESFQTAINAGHRDGRRN